MMLMASATLTSEPSISSGVREVITASGSIAIVALTLCDRPSLVASVEAPPPSEAGMKEVPCTAVVRFRWVARWASKLAWGKVPGSMSQ